MHYCRLAVRATLPEPSTQLVLLTPCQRERTHRNARTRHWPVLERNHGDRPLLERPHLRYRLPARALLDEQQFAPVKVDARSVEQQYRLERKVDCAVHILMQAIVVAWTVAQQERRGPVCGLIQAKVERKVGPRCIISSKMRFERRAASLSPKCAKPTPRGVASSVGDALTGAARGIDHRSAPAGTKAADSIDRAGRGQSDSCGLTVRA